MLLSPRLTHDVMLFQGDSGGPLMFKNGNKMEVIGKSVLVSDKHLLPTSPPTKEL